MTPAEEAAALPTLAADNAQVRRLDNVWLLTLCAAAPAATLPWFTSGYQLDVAAILSALLLLGALHLVLAAAAARPGHWLGSGRVLALLNACGVVALGVVWMNAGALQNPAFLLAFALPVIGAVFISVWQPYVTAAFALALVTGIALVRQPELRWYVQTGLGVGSGTFDALPTNGSVPIPGFFAPGGYYLVMLEAFAVLLFGSAVVGAFVAAVLRRSEARALIAADDAGEARELYASLIRNLPVPALLVEAATLRVVQISDRLISDMGVADGGPGDEKVFDVVHFSYPETIEALITGGGGSQRPCVIRTAGRLLVTEVRVQHLMHAGHRHALIVIEDITELLCVTAAFDVADSAGLILDAQGRVLGFNRTARGLFPDISLGAPADFLSRLAEGERWWEPGLNGRRKLQLEILRRLYQMTSCAVPLPGEAEALCVLAFFPLGPVSASNNSPTILTRALAR
jgi:hypothetical protein